MKRRLRYCWEYDFNITEKKEQILILEDYEFKAKRLMKNLDKCILRFIKLYPEFTEKQEDIKDIMEQFLIDVAESRELTGEME